MKIFPRRMDPRRHVAAALGWAMFAVVAMAALLAGSLAGDAAEERVRADTERLLSLFAEQVQRAIAGELATRLAILQVAATQIAASGDRSRDALRRHVDAIGKGFPEFAWIGVTDATGRVVAGTGGALEEAELSRQPWYLQAQRGPTLGEIHAAPQMHPAGPGNMRVVDAAAPLAAVNGQQQGIVVAYLDWRWIERRSAELLRSLPTHRRIELLLADRNGTVLSGPPQWQGRSLRAADGGVADFSEGGAYLVRQAGPTDFPELAGLTWTVIVRQRADAALADARSVQRLVFGVVLLSGLLAAAVAIALMRRLLGRLVRLAEDARALRRGERDQLARPSGQDEIAGIGATLSDAVAQLQQEKAALQALNAELDARVAQRTARIERLADEQKHAAVVRERLRLARDLHDTLAQSLMALLTQIRLARKIRRRLTEDELDAELARAEEVAANGLAEARAAIAQMRHNEVRDSGLGEALRELLERFTQRTGIEQRLQIEGAAGALAGERAETAFRIVEEALKNTERHADARQVWVKLSGGEAASDSGATPTLRLEVGDDGIGFDVAQERPGHYGLRGIREQAALIEARLQIDSSPGAGTRLTLEFEA